jgi:succinyl-diaminopimelate desuccinylase
MDYGELWRLAEAEREGLVAFAKRLVQTPSMPGQEADVAALLQAEMDRLGFERVWLDEVGNAVGWISGGDGPSLMLNGHMDHVDAGDLERWSHPPFDGEIHEGELWGRGAADMKGALAAMVYVGSVIKKLGASLPGDLYVSGVVQEEVGGLGARHLARELPVERVIIGEASGNHLRRGHRGRVELCATFEGWSVHASMPELGINPHFSMGRFLAGLRAMKTATDPDYGASTVVPTRVVSEPMSGNVTPSSLHLVLDWRNIPGENPEEIVAKLERVLAHSLEPGCKGHIEVVTKDLVSFTGFQMTYPDTFPSFTTTPDHPWLVEARSVLATVLRRPVEVDTWRFATDGGHFATEGATVLGFGPGDEALVHTVEERLPLEQLVESLAGYTALSLV